MRENGVYFYKQTHLEVLYILLFYLPQFVINTLFLVDFQLWLKSVGTSGLHFDTTSTEVITITCSDQTNDITSTYSVDITDEVSILETAFS